VPFPAFASEHRLAIKNTILSGISGDHDPSRSLPLVGNAISCIDTPSVKMRRHGTSYWSYVEGKPSISAGRNSPPFVRLGRKQCPVLRYNDVAKIQTEFMETQMNSFNDQAKILGEIYTKAAEDAMK
jgi:hypothetical protein